MDYDIHIDKVNLTSKYVILNSPACNFEFNDINGLGGSDWCNNYCNFTIDKYTPDEIIIPFELNISADGNYFETDEIYVHVSASNIKIDLNLTCQPNL